jgi:endogenous inhibitor of DNA gyrase (YacG/DUF329 family)
LCDILFDLRGPRALGLRLTAPRCGSRRCDGNFCSLREGLPCALPQDKFYSFCSAACARAERESITEAAGWTQHGNGLNQKCHRHGCSELGWPQPGGGRSHYCGKTCLIACRRTCNLKSAGVNSKCLGFGQSEVDPAGHSGGYYTFCSPACQRYSQQLWLNAMGPLS